ncbi:CBR-GUR-5 protein [Ditylenchus destructor]|uniref:CBR-GUR-5 protein n=1 Tax=Ditylenchus destructor TaxID=166010 RepID=A0AAD4QZK1_9BILA|nr:CBR-GUR-5 protein [Ditylenchus destructor]
MELVTLIRFTGLYYSESIEGRARYRKICLASVLILITVLYTIHFFVCKVFRSFGDAFGGIVSARNLNVEEFFYASMFTESVFSMCFLIKWQRDGSLDFMLKHTLLAQGLKDSVTVRQFRRLVRILASSVISAAVFKICHLAWIWYIYWYTRDLSEMLHWWIIDGMIFTLLLAYCALVWHTVLCVFMAVVQSLTFELEEFNRKFEKRLKSISGKPGALIDNITASFSEYSQLIEKVAQVDQILGPYAFVMLIAGSVSLVFLLLATLRESGYWCFFIPFFIDILIGIWHLFGLCVFPSRVYTEVRYIQQLLGRTPTLWNSFDPELYAVANMFADNISRADIGITLWGFTPITKSLVLTSASLLVSYITMCLQLQMGSDYASWHHRYGPCARHALSGVGIVASELAVVYIQDVLNTTHFFVRNLFPSFGAAIGGMSSARSFNVEHIFYECMFTVSVFSMYFLIKWQRDGSLDFMLKHTLLADGKNDSVIVRQFRRQVIILTSIAVSATVFKICHICWSYYLYFATRQFLRRLKSISGKPGALIDNITASFSEYSQLIEKVAQVDQILGPYAFVMLIAGSVSLVFLLLATLRESGYWCFFIPFFIDILIGIWHLFGLCVFPSRVYTEVRYIQQLLGRTPTLWNSFDPELYAVANMFADNISRADIGITLWGFRPITKSLVLTVRYIQQLLGRTPTLWNSFDPELYAVANMFADNISRADIGRL